MFDAIQNELQYRFGTQGANEGRVQKGPDGQYNIGLLGRALGVTPEMMTNAGNAFDRRTFAGTAEGQKAASYGLLPKSGAVNRFEIGKGVRRAETVESLQQQALGLGVKNALSMSDPGVLGNAIRTQTEQNANESWENSPQTKQEQDRYYDLQQDKLADRKDARDQLTFSREDAQNQRMFARRESALDRAQTQDLAILSQGHQMKLAQMNQDLAEKRMGYDRETKRMDRRDAMIAQLLAGLGQLGGAF
jgi:hypothetical protein